jgi:DNA-binding NarL/FixJ family response regulator
VQVLLLEPDRWRYLGLSHVLQSDPQIRFLGTEDPRQIISLRSPPAALRPDVIIVSRSLIVDFRLSMLEHLRTLFPGANLLVDGYEQATDVIAAILKAGAHGYFLLTSEPAKLLKALTVIRNGEIWAPRVAVALMSRTGSDPSAELDVLSPAEAAVLSLLEKGLSNKDIAGRLNIAPVTVKSHLTKLYRRFGVKTRLELLAYVVSRGLLRGAISLLPA